MREQVEVRKVLAKYKNGVLEIKNPLYYLVKALENKGIEPMISKGGNLVIKSWIKVKDIYTINLIKIEHYDKQNNLKSYEVILDISRKIELGRLNGKPW